MSLLAVLTSKCVSAFDAYVQFDRAVRLLGDAAASDALTAGNYKVTRDSTVAEPVRLVEVRRVIGRADMVDLVLEPRPSAFERYKVAVSNVQSAVAELLDPAKSASFFKGFSELTQPPLDDGSLFLKDIANSPATGDFTVDTEGDYGVETDQEFYFKKIARRFTTRPGGFAFLGLNFGLATPLKRVLTQGEVERYVSAGQAQVLQERGILQAEVFLTRNDEGAFVANIRARTRPGGREDVAVGTRQLDVQVRDQS